MSKSITPKMKYKQTVVKFSYKYGVKKVAIKFNEWPETIYRRKKKMEDIMNNQHIQEKKYK